MHWQQQSQDPTLVRRYTDLDMATGTLDCTVDLGADPPDMQDGGRFIAVNSDLDDMYVTDMQNDALWQFTDISTECGNQPTPTCLADGGSVDEPLGVVVSSTTGFVYWVNRGDGTLRRVDPASCAGGPSTDCGVTNCPITTIATGLNEPTGLVFNAAEEELYITERDNDVLFVLTATTGTF